MANEQDMPCVQVSYVPYGQLSEHDREIVNIFAGKQGVDPEQCLWGYTQTTGWVWIGAGTKPQPACDVVPTPTPNKLYRWNELSKTAQTDILRARGEGNTDRAEALQWYWAVDKDTPARQGKWVAVKAGHPLPASAMTYESGLKSGVVSDLHTDPQANKPSGVVPGEVYLWGQLSPESRDEIAQQFPGMTLDNLKSSRWRWNSNNWWEWEGSTEAEIKIGGDRKETPQQAVPQGVVVRPDKIALPVELVNELMRYGYTPVEALERLLSIAKDVVYVTTIGDGKECRLVVTHNLGTRDVNVLVRENDDWGAVVVPACRSINDNQVELEFSTPPAFDQYKCKVSKGTPVDEIEQDRKRLRKIAEDRALTVQALDARRAELEGQAQGYAVHIAELQKRAEMAESRMRPAHPVLIVPNASGYVPDDLEPIWMTAVHRAYNWTDRLDAHVLCLSPVAERILNRVRTENGNRINWNEVIVYLHNQYKNLGEELQQSWRRMKDADQRQAQLEIDLENERATWNNRKAGYEAQLREAAANKKYLDDLLAKLKEYGLDREAVADMLDDQPDPVPDLKLVYVRQVVLDYLDKWAAANGRETSNHSNNINAVVSMYNQLKHDHEASKGNSADLLEAQISDARNQLTQVVSDLYSLSTELHGNAITMASDLPGIVQQAMSLSSRLVDTKKFIDREREAKRLAARGTSTGGTLYAGESLDFSTAVNVPYKDWRNYKPGSPVLKQDAQTHVTDEQIKDALRSAKQHVRMAQERWGSFGTHNKEGKECLDQALKTLDVLSVMISNAPDALQKRAEELRGEVTMLKGQRSRLTFVQVAALHLLPERMHQVAREHRPAVIQEAVQLANEMWKALQGV
jgi:hypothetical protein